MDDFFNNVVPVYGNSFFERIINNENLHYGISKTLLYYHKKDLRFELNDFDFTILNKVEEIKMLSEKQLSELFNDLKYVAENAYTHFLKEDETIKKSFSKSILEIIDFNLEKIMIYKKITKLL